MARAPKPKRHPPLLFSTPAHWSRSTKQWHWRLPGGFRAWVREFPGGYQAECVYEPSVFRTARACSPGCETEREAIRLLEQEIRKLARAARGGINPPTLLEGLRHWG